MHQSVDMLAQPEGGVEGGNYSAFKADRSFIPKMSFFFVSSPFFFFCFAGIVGGPGRGCSAAGSRGSAGGRYECTSV